MELLLLLPCRLHVPRRIKLATLATAAEAPDADTAPAAAEAPAQGQQAAPAARMEAVPAVESNTSSSSSSSSSSAVARRRSRGRDKQQRSAGTAHVSATAGSSSGSSGSAEPFSDVVAVRSFSNATSTAAYVSKRLLNDSRASLRLNAAGGQAGLNALKLIAKAGQMIDEATALDGNSGAQLSFQVERRLVRSNSSSSSSSSSSGGARDDGARGPADLHVNAFFVQRRPGSLSADLADLGENNTPMVVRPDTVTAKITQHALYSVRHADSAALEHGAGSSKETQQAVAAFLLAGSQMATLVKVLLRGLSDARRQLYDEGAADLMFTVERSVREPTEEEQQQWLQRQRERQQQQQQQQQQQDEGKAAADDGDAVAAQVGGDSSSNASEAGPFMKAVYIIRAYTCRPKVQGRHAAQQRRSSSDERGVGSARSSSSRYVEVPAAEWAALREQLEVVPHLTQQLQTMTRQHEQLLSLLAAQQQQQGGGADAGGSSSGSA
jgi:hypothetical protein